MVVLAQHVGAADAEAEGRVRLEMAARVCNKGATAAAKAAEHRGAGRAAVMGMGGVAGGRGGLQGSGTRKLAPLASRDDVLERGSSRSVADEATAQVCDMATACRAAHPARVASHSL